MALDGTDTWILPEGLRPDQLMAALAGSFGFQTFPEYAAEVVYADSFDWRLYQRGHLIHCHDRSWTLYHGDAGEVTVQQDGPELGARCFARDFPPGPLRDLLAPLLGVRALLPLARVHLVGRQVRLLNQDDKTVARLVFERQRPAASTETFSLVRLFALRGYDEELAAVRRLLRENGVTAPASPLAGFEEGCRAAGRRPLDYSSKFSVRLDPDCTAREAMVHIYRQLLVTISRNLPGTVDDLDPEFLHDLRVAIRRTRSGLSLVKEVCRRRWSNPPAATLPPSAPSPVPPATWTCTWSSVTPTWSGCPRCCGRGWAASSPTSPPAGAPRSSAWPAACAARRPKPRSPPGSAT